MKVKHRRVVRPSVTSPVAALRASAPLLCPGRTPSGAPERRRNRTKRHGLGVDTPPILLAKVNPLTNLHPGSPISEGNVESERNRTHCMLFLNFLQEEDAVLDFPQLFLWFINRIISNYTKCISKPSCCPTIKPGEKNYRTNFAQ